MKPIPWQTEEEAEMVKEYILLPMMLDVLERDRLVLTEARFKLPEVYGALIAWLQASVTTDLTRVRQNMREHGMRVFEARRTKLGVEARYLCRGYTYELSMLWGLVKAEIVQRLCTYLGIDITKEGIFS